MKIWNEYFEIILIINLNLQDEFSILHEIQNEPAKSPMMEVLGLDCKDSKILLTFGHGQIW